MIIITTHVNADFDCLASMAAAHRIYPDATIVFSGSQEKNVREYLAVAGHHLPIVKLRNLDLAKVSHLVVVDTLSKERLGPFGVLIGSGKVTVTLYDHHPESSKDLHADEQHIAARGSCTTMMVEILREKGIAVTREEATLLMLGIYEDTGSLTFTSTCAEDFAAAAWLLENGASLNIVSDYMRRSLNTEQMEMLHDLLERMEYHSINGVEVAMAFASSKRYIGDLAMVVHALRETENIYALFIAVEMEGRIHLIARSRIPAVDAGAVAACFGGGGHPTAASATVRDMLMVDLRSNLIKALQNTIPPSPTAADIMVSPVISISKNETIVEAESMMTRYNINALPVCDGEMVAGIITRQTVEKALYHNMGKEKLADYMNTEVSKVSKDAPYETIKQIVIGKKQKVVPVVDDAGLMVGIIGRSDVMHAMYGDMMKSQAATPIVERKTARPVARDLSEVMKERLPKEMRELLANTADTATECGYAAYAVGGFVRDLIMRRSNSDVDVVIEGDGIDFAHRFVKKYGGRVRPHKKFATAIIALGNHRKMDIATARTEYYTEPAALPIVEMSSIKNDLFRRDFTVNTLAIKLNGKNKNHLIDFFGGQQDMKDEVLRVMHSLSFVEDPTRLFRAIRFEQRFHMSIASQTEKLMKLAISNRLVDRISGSRLFGELRLIFNEDQPTRAMWRMEHYGLWRFVYPSLAYGESLHLLCEQAEEAIAWHRITFDTKNLSVWMVYLLCLCTTLTEPEAEAVMARLGFMKGSIAKFLHTRKAAMETAERIAKAPPTGPLEIFDAFHTLDDEGLIVVMAASKGLETKKIIAEYMVKIRFIRPKISGGDLIKAGIASGPILGKVVNAVMRETIKGILTTKEEEMHFAKTYYTKLTGSEPITPPSA